MTRTGFTKGCARPCASPVLWRDMDRADGLDAALRLFWAILGPIRRLRPPGGVPR